MKDGITAEEVWNAPLWLSDGFMKMQLGRGVAVTDPKTVFRPFETYKTILQHGMYKE